MKVAALYDIHGNLPALEAVLEEVESEGVDLIVVGGDVAWGPFPQETIDVLRGLDTEAFIRGNADREVAGRLDATDGLTDMIAEVNVWCADLLTAEQREWLGGLPDKMSLPIEGLGDVLFCHGSPRSDEESLTHLTADERVRSALAGVAESVVVCGHTHMQFDRTVDDKRIVNAGSVGLPYQGQPGAYWALLGPDVELSRTDYNLEAAVEAMRRSGCPHVEEVFVDTILRPPSADETAERFEAASDK